MLDLIQSTNPKGRFLGIMNQNNQPLEQTYRLCSKNMSLFIVQKKAIIIGKVITTGFQLTLTREVNSFNKKKYYCWEFNETLTPFSRPINLGDLGSQASLASYKGSTWNLLWKENPRLNG